MKKIILVTILGLGLTSLQANDSLDVLEIELERSQYDNCTAGEGPKYGKFDESEYWANKTRTRTQNQEVVLSKNEEILEAAFRATRTSEDQYYES